MDDPRPGRPATVTIEQVEDAVVAMLESTSANATHWSRAKMAQRTRLSKSTIRRIWKTFELKQPEILSSTEKVRRGDIAARSGRNLWSGPDVRGLVPQTAGRHFQLLMRGDGQQMRPVGLTFPSGVSVL